MIDKQSNIYYEEPVIFHQWLFSDPKPVHDPMGVWINVCSWGMRPVLESFLLETEYQTWLTYRASAKQRLGERFVEDSSCKTLRRSTDEQVRASWKHWA